LWKWIKLIGGKKVFEELSIIFPERQYFLKTLCFFGLNHCF